MVFLNMEQLAQFTETCKTPIAFLSDESMMRICDSQVNEAIRVNHYIRTADGKDGRIVYI